MGTASAWAASGAHRINRANPVSGGRAALESSLRHAVAESPAQVYPADGVCAAGTRCALTRSGSGPLAVSASR
ncbi:MAG: hypothetical protein M3022_01840 [Actinomycetota bacterium]|nr:hypothetical protein [Actinomycetota bacterium]